MWIGLRSSFFISMLVSFTQPDHSSAAFVVKMIDSVPEEKPFVKIPELHFSSKLD